MFEREKVHQLAEVLFLTDEVSKSCVRKLGNDVLCGLEWHPEGWKVRGEHSTNDMAGFNLLLMQRGKYHY